MHYFCFEQLHCWNVFRFSYFLLIWSIITSNDTFPVCKMARRQYRVLDLRCQPENRGDNKWNKNWGNLLNPPHQRLWGHWERTRHCGGWSRHSPLVNQISFSISVPSLTRAFDRYALKNFTDKEAMLNTEDTGSMENLFEIRRYQIDIDNEQVAHLSQCISN